MTKKRKIPRKIGMMLLVILCIYCGGVVFFQHYFFPKSTVNGIPAGWHTLEGWADTMEEKKQDYSLKIETSQGQTFEIPGNTMNLQIKELINNRDISQYQNAYAWPVEIFRTHEHFNQAVVFYDWDRIWDELLKQEFMDESTWIPAQDAYISEYNGENYEIVPEVYGTEIRKNKLSQAIEAAICSMTERVNLKEEKCYVQPQIRKDDEKLKETLGVLNQYVSSRVKYHAGDKQEILDGSKIHSWLSVGENGEVIIDEKEISEYTVFLEREFNTIYKKRSFLTSYGENVSVLGGDYGWRVDENGEKEMLLRDIRAGEQIEREPVYAQEAATHDGLDIGDTYVEICLTTQHLFFYLEGELLVESEIVTGEGSVDYHGLIGTYGVIYKQLDATIECAGTPRAVKYWMPFGNERGLHDADWRNMYGCTGQDMYGNGGCVDIPGEIAQVIYESIEAGCPVVLYELSGSEVTEEIR